MLRIDQILDRINTSQMYMFDRTDFLLYCNYRMFGTSNSIPPGVLIQPYYHSLYKHIEMVYEEQFNEVFLNSSP
jgi:hypothetical protein